MNQMLLSISVTTYNHVDYIAQCLDSIIMQQTSFAYEIILGEDESDDGTREICKQYAEKYPDLIRLFLRSRDDVIFINGSATGRFNFTENLKNARGKYIALCEGDDYWTDPLKLQKQVDFLEAHKYINICFNRANLLRNNKLELHSIPKEFENKSFNYVELLRYYNFVATAGVMFRKPKKFVFPKWFFELPFGDLGLHKLMAQEQKIHCINEVMSVYRIHSKGVYSGLGKIKEKITYLKFYKIIYRHLNKEEQLVVTSKIDEKINEIATEKFSKNKFLQRIYSIYLRLN